MAVDGDLMGRRWGNGEGGALCPGLMPLPPEQTPSMSHANEMTNRAVSDK